MKFNNIHNFKLSQPEMKSIQGLLWAKIKVQKLTHESEAISGFDIAFTAQQAIGVIVTLNVKTLEVIEQQSSIVENTFEYIPGLLAFRELPVFLDVWSKLEIEPDIVCFDGHGLNHPRRMGLATHASFFIEKPTIGIAKKPFIGTFQQPAMKKGNFEYIREDDEIIGAIVRSKDDVKPIFVSIGNFITLKEAIEITLELSTNISKLPVMMRLADLEGRVLKRKITKH